MISARYLAANHLCVPQFCCKRPYFILVVCFISLFLFLFYQLSIETSTSNRTVRQTRRNRPPSGANHDSDSHPVELLNFTKENLCSNLEPELELRIEDLKRIKLSVSNELRELALEKAKLLADQDNLNARNEKLLSQIGRSKNQLRQLELDISANRRRKFDKTCDVDRYIPIIFKPIESHKIQEYSLVAKGEPIVDYTISTNRTLYQFNYSHCSLAKQFKFHLLLPQSIYQESNSTVKSVKPSRIDAYLIRGLLLSHEQYTSDADEACLLIALLDGDLSLPLFDERKNNLVINLLLDIKLSSSILSETKKHAAIASPTFFGISFRRNLDIVLPSTWQHPDNLHDILGSIPSHSPIERKFLASYFGHNFTTDSQISNEYVYKTNELENILHVIHRNSFNDLFLFIYRCRQELNSNCYEERAKMVELSVFLILFAHNPSVDDYFNDLIYLALSRGTIPVIICDEKSKLPFAEILDWHRATIIVPIARLPEIHFILRTYAASDLYLLKYNGRQLFERYLATAKQILDTTISLISLERFNYPPPPVKDIKTNTHYPTDNLIVDVNCTSSACIEAKTDILNSVVSTEILGPREKSVSSQSYRHNFSLALNSKYDLWNNQFHSPFKLHPNIPIDPLPPSEYKYYATDQGYRPIADGMGGSGSEFSRSLGGDYPNEQFTLVLLTYERKNLMLKTLERLKGMPYLNKVLIVWNGNQHEPAKDIVWPDMGAPIVVVKVHKNSLNNRFLPFDAIETEAIMSIDDDSPLRPDEIIFAFRVWRQSRERIVGFPGRFHAWNSGLNSWVYNSNHSCELSMVLTGGAFFHKFYAYQYSYNMSPVIRSIVDKFMNCEDIAMNYLVAHLTRKPPIKVTSRWTFHCSGCTASLSEDESHFRERDECLNTFASIYGYMPLMMTQSRSDSVLFKTRLPQNEQKCFKFV